MENIYKRKSDEELVMQYKQFKAIAKDQLTVHEIRMYFSLMGEISDR